MNGTQSLTVADALKALREDIQAENTLIGSRIHALVRAVPLMLPVGFSLLWLYAYHFAPR